MIDKRVVEKIVQEVIAGTDKFVVEISITRSNTIFIYMDSDTHITIDDCIAISRQVEHSLDREKEDFELQVSSYGLDRPLVLLRQYQKNIGRQLKVVLNDQTVIEGELLAADADKICIKEKPKKKKDIATEKEVLLSDVKESFVIISFNKKIKSKGDGKK